MSNLEKDIERKCSLWAIDHGWLVYKFVSPSNRGVPDKIFLKKGRIVFVEFKRPGGKLSPLQIHQIKKLKSQAFTVLVIDHVEEFINAFL